VARAAGRSIRRRPAGQRGQTLLIFALCATVVFALVGLAVDGGISYLSSQQLEKAAAAAATAGVTYMPQGFTCGPGPCTSAVAQEVDATAQANGVGLGGPEDVTITDYQVPGTCGEAGQSPCAPNECGGVGQQSCATDRLLVTVCEDVPSAFMVVLDVGAHEECQSDTAEYQSRVLMGEGTSQIGADLTTLGGPGGHVEPQMDGWDTDRSQGDALTPNPLDPSDATYSSDPNAEEEHDLNYDSWTDLPSYDFPLSQLGSASFPSGDVSGVAERGGYNYVISIPPGQSDIVQVYNPIDGPDGQAGSCAGQQLGTYGVGMGECADMTSLTTASQYSAVSYTLMSVPDLFDDSNDQTISQELVDPINAAGWASGDWQDVSCTTASLGCGTSGFTSHTGGMPNLWHQWAPICGYSPTALAKPGETKSLVVTAYGAGMSAANCVLTNPSTATGDALFRLRVDLLDYNGQDPESDGLTSNSLAVKRYAVRVVTSSGAACTGCTVQALDEMSAQLMGQNVGGSVTVPLLQIPPEWAGRDVWFEIFDPGADSCSGSSACSSISVLQPNGTTAALGNSGNGTATMWVGPDERVGWSSSGWYDVGYIEGTTPDSSDCTPGAGDGPGAPAVITTDCGPPNGVPYNSGTGRLYTGTWVYVDLQVPTNYNPGPSPSNWYWSLEWQASGVSTIQDGFTLWIDPWMDPVHVLAS
jgi:hypothetical protein